MENIKSG